MTQPLVLHAAEETLEAVHTSRHASYPAYKPSGVEWLGDVPEHWDVKRLKFVAHLANGKIEADEETTKPYIGMEHVESWTGKLRLPDEVFVPAGVSNVFRSGDVLFGKLRTYLAKATTVDFDGLCSSELMVLRSEGMDRHFLLYALLSEGFIKLVDSSTYGSKMPRANWEFIGGMLTSVPPLEEQQAIAHFLDEQTRKIDDLIEAKRSLLNLLKEKRQAVITHAVTRGLDPAAKLKPSGVEWLGDVPEHWKTLQIRRLFRTVNGATPASGGEGYWDGDIVWVTPDDLGSFEPPEIADSRRMITECGYQSCGTTMVPAGSLVVSTRAPIGYVGIAQVPMCTNQGCKSLVPTSDLDTKYYYYQLLTTEPELKSRGRGSTFAELGKTDLSSVVVASPPLEEQQEIARFLDEETQKMDDLESVVREAIETLELLRVGIISAAVTGKIDVREEGV